MLYDIAIVGGGLGGSALAAVMARCGARVVVLEREERFSDRVRGEALAPWGVAELRTLGLEDEVRGAGGREVRFFDTYFMGGLIGRRDVVETTPQGAGWMTFYHPAVQERLIEAAAAAGAEVRRGVRVRGVEAGRPASVAVEDSSGASTIAARLVVGADGRGSMVRRWAGFEPRRDQPRHLFCGVLLDGLGVPEDTNCLFFDPPNGRISFLFPQTGGRVRAYVGYHREANPPSAAPSLEGFVDTAAAIGVPREWYAGAERGGPLAMFDATDSWVEHPYRDGVALIGDAAATSDPTWGQGMSLTLRDVATLSRHLAAGDDWDAAAHAYAEEHARYYDTVRGADDCFSQLFMAVGPEAEQRRATALPFLAADQSRMIDVGMSGPEAPFDEGVRRRFFGTE